jgi:hypothetical protein
MANACNFCKYDGLPCYRKFIALKPHQLISEVRMMYFEGSRLDCYGLDDYWKI